MQDSLQLQPRAMALVVLLPWWFVGLADQPAQAQSPAAVPAIPTDWWSAVQRDIVAREYEVSWQAKSPSADDAGSWQAPNRAQRFRTRFGPDGIFISPREAPASGSSPWEWGLHLCAWGRAGAMRPVDSAVVSAIGNLVEYARGGLVEWYVNDARGLEQGFTVLTKPTDGQPSACDVHAQIASSASRPLRIEMTITGALLGSLSADERLIHLTMAAPGGAHVLNYGGLYAIDAGGRWLPAWFELSAGTLAILVDDRDAVYPITIDPLSSTPSWSAESNQADAEFGYAVAPAGDVNGDGYADVVVGAPDYDNGGFYQGRVFAYYGGPVGLSATPDWVMSHQGPGGFAPDFGKSVAGAGDVNGDGYADVIIGATLFDSSPSPGNDYAGAAFVYLGSSTGLATTPAWQVVGQPTDGDGWRLGYAVATAGDVNGDGFADVAIGAPGYCVSGNCGLANFWVGRIEVYLGSPGGLPDTPNWFRNGGLSNAGFGERLATAGDINGDGRCDLIAGLPGAGLGDGQARVWHGTPSGLSSSPNGNVLLGETGGFGSCVGTAGDVNGDGYADAFISGSNGVIRIYHGSSGGISQFATTTFSVSGLSFKDTISTAGDVNGDGYADLLVGAPGYTNGQSAEGRISVFLGGAGGLSTTPAWSFESDQAGANLGWSAATAGDINGDGFADVIAGAFRFDNGEVDEGRVFAFLGSPAGITWSAESNQAGAEQGFSVASAGDVNGDGYSDAIVGAPRYDNGQADEGRVFVYHGSATGLNTAFNWSDERNQAGAQYGYSVAGAGDVNGDGYADIVIGAPFYDAIGVDDGRAFVFHGSGIGLDLSPAWFGDANQAGALYGISVASAGDVNGDGHGDVIVGAHGYDNGQTDEGAAFVYHGAPGGISATANWFAEPNQAGARLGVSVSSAGDVNRDGYSDVIVGCPFWDTLNSDVGRAFVWHGSSGGLGANGTPTNAPWSPTASQASAFFGLAVSGAGDVNGDGYSDVIVGAPGYDGGQTDEGRVFVYQGAVAGLATSATWIRESDQASAEFGRAVAGAGDVNGDGFADILIGAHLYDNGQTNEGRAFLYLGSPAGLPSPSVDTATSGAAWIGEPDQAEARYGWGIGGGGDFNGDGYADFLVGAPRFDNGQTDEGRAWAYYGNGGAGLPYNPRQRRADNARPLAPLGRSDSETSFRLAARGRTPFGRAKVKLQWEIKELATPLNASGLQQGASWSDTGIAGVELNQLVSGLGSGKVYHWRARLLYDAVTTPFGQSSRWFTMPLNGWNEADFRTPGTPIPPPTITMNPTGANRCVGGSANFTVAASGTPPLNYQWRRNGSAVSNGGAVSGATTATLTINPVGLSNSGNYDCVVYNGGGSVISTSASLVVYNVTPGDTNFDGANDGRDIPAFVAAVRSGGSPLNAPYCASDLNGDGVVTLADVPLFVALLLSQ